MEVLPRKGEKVAADLRIARPSFPGVWQPPDPASLARVPLQQNSEFHNPHFIYFTKSPTARRNISFWSTKVRWPLFRRNRLIQIWKVAFTPGCLHVGLLWWRSGNAGNFFPFGIYGGRGVFPLLYEQPDLSDFLVF